MRELESYVSKDHNELSSRRLERRAGSYQLDLPTWQEIEQTKKNFPYKRQNFEWISCHEREARLSELGILRIFTDRSRETLENIWINLLKRKFLRDSLDIM